MSLEPGSAAIDTLRSRRAKVGVVVEAVLGSPNSAEYDHMNRSDVPRGGCSTWDSSNVAFSAGVVILRGPVLYLSPFKLQIQVENHAIGGFGRSVPNTL